MSSIENVLQKYIKKNDTPVTHTIIPNENNIYFNYFKGLALKAAGKEEQASNEFIKIANTNFSNWEIAIVRGLASNQLGKV